MELYQALLKAVITRNKILTADVMPFVFPSALQIYRLAFLLSSLAWSVIHREYSVFYFSLRTFCVLSPYDLHADIVRC
jgi:hypothetical protein